VRGFRVEPGEIEAALIEHPAVCEAVVTAQDQPEGEGRRLVAYVVASPGLEVPGTASLREHLGRRLPEHMLPAVFVPLAALPLTPAGKVDRRALPASYAPERDLAAGAPRTPAEEVLAEIWSQVLGAGQ